MNTTLAGPHRRHAGITLVELTVVLAISMPLLLVIMSATKAATGSFAATSANSDEAEFALRAVDNIEDVLRAARRQTLQVQATRNDVRDGRAAAVGDWCPMIERSPRSMLRVETATGDEGPALRLPTEVHTLTFVPDRTDPTNGRDDDRDGLVDEGTLQWAHDDITFAVAKQVELCTFELEGSAIRFALRFAIPDRRGALRRTTVEHTVRLNNP